MGRYRVLPTGLPVTLIDLLPIRASNLWAKQRTSTLKMTYHFNTMLLSVDRVATEGKETGWTRLKTSSFIHSIDFTAANVNLGLQPNTLMYYCHGIAVSL